MQSRLINMKVIVTTAILLMALASLSYGPSAVAAGHSVTNITLNPPTPNVLVHNQSVTVSFRYATTQAGGVRIFVRPMAGGSPAPNYSASGADVSPIGSGTGTQNFTIKSGNVTVDHIRIQMWNANQTILLFEALVPVSYEFRSP